LDAYLIDLFTRRITAIKSFQAHTAYALNGIFFALIPAAHEHTGCKLPQMLTAADCNTRNLTE
jgi:hypothetical protein